MDHLTRTLWHQQQSHGAAALVPSDKGGYAKGAEHYGKTLRREVLRVRLATCEARLAPGGHLSIVRGGRHLLGLRHHLDEARISPARWREDWEAARSIISANGSHDELGGNLTIRVSPDGTCSILLPEPLRHLANAGDHYRLDASVAFPYRQAPVRQHRGVVVGATASESGDPLQALTHL